MENNTALTVDSTDEELMEAYELHRRNANGQAVGEITDTCEQAAQREEWEVIRHIYGGTNQPGKPVLARSISGDLWVINDLDGPWGILVQERQ
jgi:hypothetical protein